MCTHPILNHKLAALHQDELLATAARLHRAAAARATPRSSSNARYVIGAALIWLGAWLQRAPHDVRPVAHFPTAR